MGIIAGYRSRPRALLSWSGNKRQIGECAMPLAAGYRARLAALLLALFTAFVSPIFHAFWSAPPDQALVQMLFFTKNVAIFGGLLHVAGRGTGRLALQRE